ncbi:hypothetical protein SDRG_03945 [Saprolegnia diclina VS20]|uniref:Peptidase S33 tripeptidyl aminopeptidase-like C-terminal domain-containing protein n=1 Tax=Saprolegnia diclina (strain VS20) TaxID=1156394 RepID=T0S8N9_SAPDV|nr:hypothetical protein SDRG_03945 [Saprolegnia diclina VS20]EQC38992.1 hypothetical protein SDRG_03945 [Saprolegnia diclina VS20]|eukprot:XP_008607816.1 hypothetical protein SDRG_03945 [Saprolegnia diclina VS20]
MESAIAVPVPLATLVRSSFAESPDNTQHDASYVVDVDVKETKWLLASWTSRQIVLTAKALEVFDGDKLQWACNTTACTTRILDALDTTRRFPFELCEHGKTRAVINVPTASARDELLECLYAASSGVAWPSRVDDWTRFLSVARRIKESRPKGPAVPKCNVSIDLVQRHLEGIIDVYTVTGSFTDIVDVYSYFLEQERLYVAGGATNFAHTVHRLHPVDLYASKNEPSLTPLADVVSTCAHCNASLPPAISFQMHILLQPVMCPACDGPLLYETYKVLAFLAAYPGVLARFPGVTATRYGARLHTPPGVPRDGHFATFFAALLDMVLSCEHSVELGAPSLRTSLCKLANTIDQQAVGAYSIDLVQAMFRQLDYINKMVPHTEYWKHPEVVAAAIVRYEQFMYLLGKRSRNERDLKTALTKLYKALDSDPKGSACAKLLESSSSPPSATLRSLFSELLQDQTLRSMIPALVYRFTRCSKDDVTAITNFAIQIDIDDNTPSPSDSYRSTMLYKLIVSSELWRTPTESYDTLKKTFMNTLIGSNVASLVTTYCIASGGSDPNCAQERAPSNSYKWQYLRDTYYDVPITIPKGTSVLLMSGLLDPQTAARGARNQYDSFIGSAKRLVEFNYSAHGTIVNTPVTTKGGAPCAAQLVASFVTVDGDVTALDTSCLATVAPMSFAIKPSLAKSYLATDDIYDGVPTEKFTAASTQAPGTSAGDGPATTSDTVASGYKTAVIIGYVLVAGLVVVLLVLVLRQRKKQQQAHSTLYVEPTPA